MTMVSENQRVTKSNSSGGNTKTPAVSSGSFRLVAHLESLEDTSGNQIEVCGVFTSRSGVAYGTADSEG
jgi:hypothetical protein